ncbi:MAG: MarR family transcriptional regulator [Bauldia sp.]|nr:MarR family transcriptional regulator [Bauldia sp.]
MRHERPDPAGEFIERMGFLCEADGLPRISGRLLGLLILEGGPFTLKELAQRLNVSRASVSTNARLLAKTGIIERVAVPGDRQDYYALDENPGARIHAGVLERLERTYQTLRSAEKDLPREMDDARRRVRSFGEFYGTVIRHMKALAKEFPSAE